MGFGYTADEVVAAVRFQRRTFGYCFSISVCVFFIFVVGLALDSQIGISTREESRTEHIRHDRERVDYTVRPFCFRKVFDWVSLIGLSRGEMNFVLADNSVVAMYFDLESCVLMPVQVRQSSELTMKVI